MIASSSELCTCKFSVKDGRERVEVCPTCKPQCDERHEAFVIGMRARTTEMWAEDLI